MRHALVCALFVAAAGCSLDVHYDTTGSACDVDSDCATGASCVDSRCAMPPTAPTCAAAIGTGGGHSCAVRDDGLAFCWGDNSYGQLGNNARAISDTPVAVVDPATLGGGAAALPKLASISGGALHTCAIDVAGGVWCWGDNRQGQLGVATTSDFSLVPLKVGVTGKATKVVTGAAHSCALLDGGAISCWGNNEAGQLGNGTSGGHSPTPTTASLTGAVALAAGNYTTCAVDGNATALCWGADDDGQFGDGKTGEGAHPVPVAMPGVTGAIDVALGDNFACALTSAGEVYCSGRNDVGQAGEEFDDSQPTPNKIALPTKAVRLSAADRIACTIDDQKQVWCWGANDNRELADGTNQNQAFPVHASYPDALAISVGRGFVCVRSIDGLRCAGFDGTGALGDGVHTLSNVPVAVTGLTGVAAIALGNGFSCAVLGDTTAACWGANWTGQLGDATWTSRAKPAPVVGLTGITKLVAGERHACALLQDGTLACWGNNDHGQLGEGGYDTRGQPRLVASGVNTMTGRPLPTPLSNVVDIAAGDSHTCAVLGDGGVRCWGYNLTRQLGDGAASPGDGHATPFTLTLPAGMMGAIAIAAGGGHSCAIDKAHKVWCWGANGVGQLGAGDAANPSAVPLAVTGMSGELIDQLSTLGGFTCAHAQSNKAWCWGYNSDGDLGIDGNSMYAYDTAQSVTNLSVQKIAAGDNHACALTVDKRVLCWGGNYLGQTTGDVYQSFAIKTEVVAVAGATDLAAGGGHTCAVVGGAVQCWGDGRDGELGNGVMARDTPVAPMLTCPE